MHPIRNFTAYLTEVRDGRVMLVPGSVRVGHNVFTRTGLEWLSQLVRWQMPIDGISPDTAITQNRLRWVGVGSGSQLENRDIVSLVTPLVIAGGNYVQLLSAPTNPTAYAIKFTSVFDPTTFAGGNVSIGEAAYYVDENGALDSTSPSNLPVSYKRIDPPLAKTGANTLTIKWEYRF